MYPPKKTCFKVLLRLAELPPVSMARRSTTAPRAGAKKPRCQDGGAMIRAQALDQRDPRAGQALQDTACSNGWVAERFKAPVLKTGRGESPSWLRTPLHPPSVFALPAPLPIWNQQAGFPPAARAIATAVRRPVSKLQLTRFKEAILAGAYRPLQRCSMARLSFAMKSRRGERKLCRIMMILAIMSYCRIVTPALRRI